MGTGMGRFCPVGDRNVETKLDEEFSVAILISRPYVVVGAEEAYDLDRRYCQYNYE